MNFRRRVFLTLCLLGTAGPVSALPAFRRLYESRAGYAPNCTLCHKPGARRLTPYAREFLRLGRDADAVNALEVMDPDRDGFSSKIERESRSNPGDPRSTPDHPGDWLSTPPAPPDFSPAFHKIFGPGVVYETTEGRLSSAQVEKAERFLDKKLRDEDLSPTLFLVRKAAGGGTPDIPRPSARASPPESAPGEKPLAGYAGYAYFGDKEGLTVFLVGVNTDFVLQGVWPLRVRGDQRLAKRDYVEQFRGRTHATLQGVSPPKGAEEENARLLTAVRRSLKLMELSAPAR